jgi:hypothetical protein
LTPDSQTARATASLPDKNNRLAAGAGITAAMNAPVINRKAFHYKRAFDG